MKRILGILIGLVGAVTLITGCSKGKDPQVKEEPSSVKVTSIPKKKDNSGGPTKKESSGKEEVIDLGKGIKLEMVLIPAGKFIMGSPESEKGRNKEESQHEVTLTSPYYLGKYEVTQEQWESVMANIPSRRKGAKLAVTNVSWNDCQEFIKKLNVKTNSDYRLPSEAEWEYACRAGTTTAYSFGDNITKSEANIEGGASGVIKAVGSYKPNAFGLYDMHGNAEEWCEDWRAKYPAESVTDPKGPTKGGSRVLRGGFLLEAPVYVRSSRRQGDLPGDRDLGYYGFRLAKTK